MNNISKYYNIEKYFKNQQSNEISLSFSEIEEILGEPLPKSAYDYEAWWANGGHLHANSWLDAGWEVEKIKLGEKIDFIKKTHNKEQQVKINKKYRHFKGKEYLVLYVAKHSETLEDMVVYQALYGDMGIWVRPLSMFLETIERDGKKLKRFEEIKETE